MSSKSAYALLHLLNHSQNIRADLEVYLGYPVCLLILAVVVNVWFSCSFVWKHYIDSLWLVFSASHVPYIRCDDAYFFVKLHSRLEESERDLYYMMRVKNPQQTFHTLLPYISSHLSEKGSLRNWQVQEHTNSIFQSFSKTQQLSSNVLHYNIKSNKSHLPTLPPPQLRFRSISPIAHSEPSAAGP